MLQFLSFVAERPLSFKERVQWSRFFKGEKPVKGAIRLSHRRIFILPTRSGLGYCVLLLLLMLIAFVYNNNLAYLLAFLLTSVLIVTILQTFRALSGLIVTVGQSQPVFAGDVAFIPVELENPANYERYQVQVGKEGGETLAISAYGRQQAAFMMTLHKRGWQALGTIKISSTFPLGLFRAWSPLRFDHPVLVYPKPGQALIYLPEGSGDTAQSGLSKKSGGDDFSGLREYAYGDSPKHIHWKAFAKGQGLLTKEYCVEGASEVYFDFATTPGANVEERLSQLCRWVIDAEAAGIRYGFKLPGLNLPPASGSVHSAQCLQALALF